MISLLTKPQSPIFGFDSLLAPGCRKSPQLFVRRIKKTPAETLTVPVGYLDADQTSYLSADPDGSFELIPPIGEPFDDETSSAESVLFDQPLFTGSMQPLVAEGAVGVAGDDLAWNDFLLSSMLGAQGATFGNGFAEDEYSPALSAASVGESTGLDQLVLDDISARAVSFSHLDLSAYDSSGSSLRVPDGHHPKPTATQRRRRSSGENKLHKATHACDLCIQRKRRCDGFPAASSPTGAVKGCTYCASHGEECKFTREVKKRGPKSKKMLEEMAAGAAVFSEDSHGSDLDVTARLERLEKVTEGIIRKRAKSFSAVHDAKQKQREHGGLEPAAERAFTFSEGHGASLDPLTLASSSGAPSSTVLQSLLLAAAQGKVASHDPAMAVPTSVPAEHPYTKYHSSATADDPPCVWDPETGFYDASDVEAMMQAAGGLSNEGDGEMGWLRIPWKF
ncbi:hypothetical protein DFJ74DRAFT_711897 [Hyaloraphidium curvatum]|nr:hypothetical protein DFJ74DRAFT_711897 [Hyaloraphidium curvatum]